MMQIGLDELAAHLSETIQQVREGETVEVTSDGKVVALLVRPGISQDNMNDSLVPDIAERHAALARLDALAQEIGKQVTWPTDMAAMLSEMRR